MFICNRRRCRSLILVMTVMMKWMLFLIVNNAPLLLWRRTQKFCAPTDSIDCLSIGGFQCIDATNANTFYVWFAIALSIVSCGATAVDCVLCIFERWMAHSIIISNFIGCCWWSVVNKRHTIRLRAIRNCECGRRLDRQQQVGRSAACNSRANFSQCKIDLLSAAVTSGERLRMAAHEAYFCSHNALSTHRTTEKRKIKRQFFNAIRSHLSKPQKNNMLFSNSEQNGDARIRKHT